MSVRVVGRMPVPNVVIIVEILIFSARCDVIYTSRAYANMPVRLSICDVCALWSQGAMDPGYLCMLG